MKNKIYKKGFTLIEMLVVVLIIGILAAIALPQYRTAVTKAKVAAMLPTMRAWKDALMEYKLVHGDYSGIDYGTGGDILGVSWPEIFPECGRNSTSSIHCWDNDFWNECFANEEEDGAVYCTTSDFSLKMYQYDDGNEFYCRSDNSIGEKLCQSLGGEKMDSNLYKLN